MLDGAPSFGDIADAVFNLMDGRVWAGHNILSYDIPVLQRAFTRLGRTPPQPRGTLDTLKALRKTLGGHVTGGFSLANLGMHFGLGVERHRALGDVRLNIEVFQAASSVYYLQHVCHSRSWGEQPRKKKRNGQETTTQQQQQQTQQQHMAEEEDHIMVSGGEELLGPAAGASGDDGISTEEIDVRRDAVIRALDTAMHHNEGVWLRYSGGRKPGVAQKVMPLAWVVRASCKPKTIFRAVVHPDATETQFSVNKVACLTLITAATEDGAAAKNNNSHDNDNNDRNDNNNNNNNSSSNSNGGDGDNLRRLPPSITEAASVQVVPATGSPTPQASSKGKSVPLV